MFQIKKGTGSKFKVSGNIEFVKGNYSEAIELYTKAICQSRTNPAYFSNRALSYFR